MENLKPVRTAIRIKCSQTILAVQRAIAKITKGKRPLSLFMAAYELKDINTPVRVVEKTETSVTIAKYNPDGTIADGGFKIMTATDFHLESYDPALNRKSIRNFIRQIEDNKPDLVIITGDVIQSDFQPTDCVQFSQMMEKLGVYWCYVFGNHEAREEKEYFKYLMYKGLQSCPHCLNLFGDPSLFGYGNFTVNILKNENELLKSLFLFDSGRDICDYTKKELGLPADLNGYDFIKPTQIKWYLDTTAELHSRCGDFKTMTFMHIPVPEYKQVFDGDEGSGFKDSGKTEILYGTQFESVGCSPFNSGLFDAAVKEGSLQAMYSGHDHINDFCALYKGVYLVYTQCSGYNTYNMTEKKGWAEKDCHYGVTLTTLNKDGTVKIEQKKHSVYLG